MSKSGVLSCGISDCDAVFMTKSMRLPKLKASPRLLNVINYKKFNLGRLSEAKKGVARAYGAKMHQRNLAEHFVWCIFAPTEARGYIKRPLGKI